MLQRFGQTIPKLPLSLQREFLGLLEQLLHRAHGDPRSGNRVGRVDRVSSASERRLAGLPRPPEGREKLQVFYPFLPQTVEVLQVQTVLGRLDNFVRLMHEDLAAPQREQRHIDIGTAIHRTLAPQSAPGPLPAPLRSAFEIDPKLLVGPKRSLRSDEDAARALRHRFAQLAEHPLPGLEIQWEDHPPAGTLLGTATILGRQQPFTLLARSFHGQLLIRCVSPVGRVLDESRLEEIAATARGHAVRVTSLHQEKFDCYDVAAEVDALFNKPAFDAVIAADLVRRACAAADQLERVLLGVDEPMAKFEVDLKEELRVAR